MSASTKRRRPSIDVRIEHHGSLYLLRPLSAAGGDWTIRNTPVGPETQYFGGALVVEPRYVAGVVAGMRGDGLVVQ